MAQASELVANSNLLQQLVDRPPRLPAGTYRLQFHAGFRFADAQQIVKYLRDLGITHCYASPYLKARPGSTHGYDIADHRVLNPEIGTAEDFAAWVGAMQAEGMSQILDMVPNHMGVIGSDNSWWHDVLENGLASPYANYFDIAWTSSPRPQLHNRVLIPILGDPYGKALESGQLQVVFHDGALSVQYFSHRFPVDPATYDLVLGQNLEQLESLLAVGELALTEYHSVLTAIRHLPPHTATEPEKIAERQREKEVIKRRIAALVQENEIVRSHIEKNVQLLNGEPGKRETFDMLDVLLDRQAYRLSFWRVAADEINYRRFFDINELAALNMEREEVFVATHEFVLRLLASGAIDGLRIDHPDGLYDPKQYLQWLQLHYLLAVARTSDELSNADEKSRAEAEAALRQQLLQMQRERGASFRPLYVVVEKILGGNERLSTDWPTHGTSGYDFLNMVNGLFVDSSNAEALTRLYTDWIEDKSRFPEVAYRNKSLILETSLSSELHMLAHQLDRLAQKDRWSRDFTFNGIRQALAEVIACFPVYRSYIGDEGVTEADKLYVHTAINRAIGRNPTTNRSIFYFIRDMLLLKYRDHFGGDDQQEQRRFAGKFQQVTSPVAAKGIEDTAFYVYTRLVSLNEVGGEPERFGISAEKLHRYCEDRQKNWPYSLSSLSTHDTKRSEDVRARINALSEIPDQWRERITRWSELNARFRRFVDDAPVPDRNEEYFLYQTLIGTWPFAELNDQQLADYIERIKNYMAKALHEAKIHTSWINPNSDYDEAIGEFVSRILSPAENADFISDLTQFHKRISRWGVFNSLAQTLLRITLPGVPDTYQGTELWDFSLVDPDNRRPVDYELRRQLLADLKARISKAGRDRRAVAAELLNEFEDGRVKLFVTWQALQCRRHDQELFASGEYRPLEITGAKREHLFAFLRSSDEQHSIVVVPRRIASLCPNPEVPPVGANVWENTAVSLPAELGRLRVRSVFTGELLEPGEAESGRSYWAAQLLGHFPIALLLSEQN